MDTFDPYPTRRCSFCETVRASRYFSSPRALLCSDCARRNPEAFPVPPGTRCAFCSRVIGARRGFLWRRRVTVALIGHEVVCCSDCLATARDILAEEAKAAV